MKTTRLLLIIALSCLMAGGSFAQDPVALIEEGAPAAGLPEGSTITSINNSGVNHNGGWGFTANSVDAAGATISVVWGNLMGGPGSLIRAEDTFAPYQQNSFESFWGMGETYVSYSPSCTNIDNLTDGLDGVWINDTPIAVEEMAYAHEPGLFFSFGSRPGCTQDGVPYFVGGLTDTQGGSTQQRGLFYGADAQALYKTGDLLPGLPTALSGTGAISFDFRFSRNGSHHMSEVIINASSSEDNCMVFDGEGMMIGGALVREGTPMPVSAGGQNGENWDNFDFLSVTESGSYLMTGDTDGDTDKDEFLIKDGQVILRESQEIAGYVISGSIEGAYMNEAGDWACIWDVDLPTGENVEALIYNGDLIIKEGDFIDTNGDGVPDPDSIVDSFTGISSVTVSEPDDDNNVTVYFTADVSVGSVPTSSPDQTVVRADAEEGLDEDFIIDGQTRDVIEFGYGVTFGGVVPTMLGGMECLALETGVRVNWRMNGMDDDVALHLRASDGDRVWDVAFNADNDGRFTAVDGGAFGGEVTYTLYLVDASGDERVLGEQTLELDTPAAKLVLDGAYPNPFNPETKILFRVGEEQVVRVAIYDIAGNLVDTLADDLFGIGVHEVSWMGRDRSGASVPSGTYFARVLGDSGVQTTKLLLVK